MIVGGLDPGLKGALALVDPGPPLRLVGWAVWDTRRSTGSLREASRRVSEAITAGCGQLLDGVEVVVEDARSRPGQGVASSHAFGLGRGAAEAAAVGLGAKLVSVQPAQWKRAMGCTLHPKKRALQVGRWFLPGLPRNLDVADAVLMAIYRAYMLAGMQRPGILS